MPEEKKNEVLDQEKELDADELDAVAGGGDCYCAIGGGGTADEDAKTCACVLGGGGEYDYGSPRCACVAYGEGH